MTHSHYANVNMQHSHVGMWLWGTLVFAADIARGQGQAVAFGQQVDLRAEFARSAGLGPVRAPFFWSVRGAVHDRARPVEQGFAAEGRLKSISPAALRREWRARLAAT